MSSDSIQYGAGSGNTSDVPGHPSAEQLCQNCGAVEVEPGYALSLCETCRTAFVNRPFPWWVKLTAIAVLVVVATSAILSGPAIRAAHEFNQGKRFEGQSQYAEAAKYYEMVLNRYPDSTDVLVRYAVCAYRGQVYTRLPEVLQKLGGRKVDRRTADEVNAVVVGLAHVLNQAGN
jgi:hypothetical protein